MKKKQVSVTPPEGVHFYCAQCATALNSKQQNFMIDIPDGAGKFRIMASNLICIKPNSNYSVFHFFDEHHVNRVRTKICRATLESWEWLDCIGLQRVRDNCIVNLTKVYYIGRNRVIEFYGQDENEVSITEKYKDETDAALKIWNPVFAQ